jgi:hypothetical protein
MAKALGTTPEEEHKEGISKLAQVRDEFSLPWIEAKIGFSK